MDATQYEQRVRETARAMGYDPATIDRMFSPEVNAMAAAQDARADQQERHQEARRLALAHVAQEQAAADPGAAEAYEAQFREYARSMGYDARTVEAMAALPVDGGASQARVADLTRRYAEALRVQEAGGGQQGDGRPFEVGDPEQDPFYANLLGLSRMVDAREGGTRNVDDTLRLWECREGIRHLQEMNAAGGTQRVQEAAVYPIDVQDAPESAYRVKLIAAGPTSTGKRFYEGGALREAVQAGRFDGAKMYLNHVKPGRDVPHRDLRDWAATIKPGSVTFDQATGEVWGIVVPHDPRVQTMLSTPTTRRALGVSVDANVRVKRGADGLEHITAISHLHSVDFVPEGNATGAP